ADMEQVASRLATQASQPIVLDSTEAEVVETGLSWIGGRAVLNSVNLEDGDAPGTRLDRFLSLAREYGAAVVCTCIDTEGQARTADWKLRAARAGLDAAIVHAGRILPLNRIDERQRQVCLDLVYDRRGEGYDPLSELLSLFEGVSSSATTSAEDRSGWSLERRLEQRIVDGDRNGL